MNNPFDYEPHPLCIKATEQVCDYLSRQDLWTNEIEAGKMFGVLVCKNDAGQIGFLAAYSGQICGREDWPWFVPAVFDYLQPSGHFKQEESHISDINQKIRQLENAADYLRFQNDLEVAKGQAADEIETYKRMMQESKQRRDDLRHTGIDEQAMIRESQFQKAELRRMKSRWNDILQDLQQRIQPCLDEISLLKDERKQRSDALQQWLFDNFVLTNYRGEKRSLTSIFSTTPQQKPPSGAGECCAPKLFHYAYTNGLHPLCIAEFWQGRSPLREIRHHNHFYTACRGKCLPILEWMLNWDEVENTHSTKEDLQSRAMKIIFEDTDILVVNKPAGLLSVPGKSKAPSVESLLRESYGQVFMVHRLDMDTSGLLVVARTPAAYHSLQHQFLHHSIEKNYIALLDGITEYEGDIKLPVRRDITDRPRQIVDQEHGKPSHTSVRILSYADGKTRVSLTPHTGRTHQLRVHCAHHLGLGLPIVGDPLYGCKSDRLYLHAETLTFTHPVTGKRMSFHAKADF